MNVILFDIDGTLIRCGGAGLHALLVVMREEFGVGPSSSAALSSARGALAGRPACRDMPPPPRLAEVGRLYRRLP